MENSAGQRYTGLLEQARKCLDDAELLHARAHCYLASIVLCMEEKDAEGLAREIAEAGAWLRSLPGPVLPAGATPLPQAPTAAENQAHADRIREIKAKAIERLGKTLPVVPPPPPKKS